MTAPTLAPPPAAPPARPSPAPGPPPDRTTTNPASWGRHPLVRIPSLLIGGLVTVALLGGVTFVLANVMVRTTTTDSTTLTGEVRRADIHVTGSVTVTTGRVDRVEIERRSSYGVTEPRITEELVDGLLTVRVECVGGLSVICSNQVDLVVPSAVSFSIEALGVDVSDIQGDVEIDSGAGSVDLERLSGDLDISVGGGSIDGHDLRSARVRADAGAGTVDIGFATPPEDVDAVSGAGSVRVWLPPGEETYRVDAEAGAGSDVVTVRTDPTSDRVVRASSGAGNAEVRYQP